MKICIAGGDKRTVALARLFENAGFQCSLFGFDKLPEDYRHSLNFTDDLSIAMEGAEVVLMPFPCLKNGFLNTAFSDRCTELESVFEFNDGKRLFLGGKLPYKGENIKDYSLCEDFLRYNAVSTAEGALQIAMSRLECTIHSSEIAVIGYGRIGSYLTKLLLGLGAKVWVIARSTESRASAEISGAYAVGFENTEAPLSCARIVFNTVPHKIIGDSELSYIKSGGVIVDLASLPGGADEKECEERGIKLIRALGLPGKVAPESAGLAVFKTVLPIIADWGIKI